MDGSNLTFLPQQEHTLAFRCLVMGPFDPAVADSPKFEPVAISATTFDQVLGLVKPEAQLDIENEFLCRLLGIDPQTLDITYPVNERADFSPKRIIQRDPRLSQVLELNGTLKTWLESGAMELVSSELTHFDLRIEELDQSPTARADIELLVCKLDLLLSSILDDILHHPNWQVLEAAWRGLYWLCEKAAGTSHCEVMLLPVTREVLWEDLVNTPVEDSRLFATIYSESYGQFGATPFGALMLDDYFSAAGGDLSLVKALARIAALAHVPLVTGAAPEMFGLRSHSDLLGTDSLAEIQQGPRYIKWRGFINTADASYLSMTLPRIRIRDAYVGSDKDLLLSSFDWYDESIGGENEHCLWVNASYAFVLTLINSFAEHGFCSNISGPEGGRIEMSSVSGRAGELPVEYVLSESREAELVNLGFNPVATRRFTNELLFPSANSLRWGGIYLDRFNPSVEALASAQLHYLMVVLRVAHCVKVIFRERIGSYESVESLSDFLNRWLRQFVSDVEEPSQALRAKRPLRDGTIHVAEGKALGEFDVNVELHPHMKFYGSDVGLDVTLPMTAEAI
jgi:type VI secretion system protein ImpC